jgi:hypothetical protein
MSPEVFEAGSKYFKALAISLPDNFANERETRKLQTELVKNQAEYVLKTFDLATATEEQLRFIPAESVPPALVWKSSEHEDNGRGLF